MWWKANKWKVLLPVIAAAVLALAFWYGGSAPGLQGWTAGEPPAPAPSQTASPLPSETAQATAAVAVTDVPHSPPPSVEPSSTPTPSAEPSASPTPSPTPSAEPTPAAAESGMEINPDTGKDQYLTDPVPEGRPIPVEPQDVTISDAAHTCTISISCATILDHMDWLDGEKEELVPQDGVILPPTAVTFYEGESVFNVLQRTCKQNKIHLEFANTPLYNSAYIEGIHNLYEFDCGELSGWMYKVNDWFPNYGCSRYGLQEGDTVEWVFSCDLGEDVGGGYATGNLGLGR